MVFPQCCSDPGTCPCSFCILSVILYGSAAQRLDEELHLGFMWRNLNNVSQNFRLCWRDECRISCRVPTFQSVSTLKRSSRESFFFPSTFFFFSTLSFASPSLGLIAHLWWSGHQQVPEHHVFPRSAVWASGCLPPVTPTVRDGPNLPAASHTSETAAGGMSRSTYISVWWWGCSVDILCCFFFTSLPFATVYSANSWGTRFTLESKANLL